MASDTGSNEQAIVDEMDLESQRLILKATAAHDAGQVATASVLLMTVVSCELVRIRRAMEFMADQYRKAH